MSSGLHFPVAFLDPPRILDAAVTSIPGSGDVPVEVVNDLGPLCAIAVDYIDSTSEFIGVYVGPLGQEQLKCIIGGGLTERAYAVFPIHSRVSLRSMNAAAITNGELVCTFMSY